jgi:hypothetical protein
VTTFLYQPPESDRKIKSIACRSPNKRLDSVMRHISVRWLPVNKGILKNINQNLESGEFISDRESLIEEIKKDPALFLYCSRRTSHFADSFDIVPNPFDLIRNIDDSNLVKLFKVSPYLISPHEISKMGQQQALALQYSLLTTFAAEAIAKAHPELSEGTAYSAAFFRQLGYNLIAWNYPKIYTDALYGYRIHKNDLDSELSNYLGVSPLAIALQYAKEWNVHSEIRKQISLYRSQTFSEEGSLDLSYLANKKIELSALCQIAELYGRSKDPLNYPSAEAEWVQNLQYIEQQVPTGVLSEIDQRVASALGDYCDTSKFILTLPIAEEFHLTIAADDNPSDEDEATESSAVFNNLNLQRCSTDVRESFERVFKMIEHKEPVINILNEIIGPLFSKLGFDRGCVFISKKNSERLAPILRLGNTSLDYYKTLNIETRANIRSAKWGNLPLKKEFIRNDGTFCQQIFGSIINRTHNGVLYIEASPETPTDNDKYTLLLFNALRETLAICLEQ